MIHQWNKTGAVWHTDVDKVGRYSVRRTRQRGPYAAYLNNERLMSESVNNNAEVVKRYVETRIETARRINAETDGLRAVGRRNFTNAAIEQNLNVGMRAGDKVLVGLVDCTPTWAEILPVLTNAIEHGNAAQQEVAREQLQKMASLADAYNVLAREQARVHADTLALQGGGNG